MGFSEYVDCELLIIDRDQARLSVEGRVYSGRPTLSTALERQLLEVDLEPARYGTLLFQALLPEGDDLLSGYRASLTIARRESRRLRLRLHFAGAAPSELQDLHWELLFDPVEKSALGRSQETAFSRFLEGSLEPGRAVAGQPKLLVVDSCPRDLADFGLPSVDREALRGALEEALSPLAELMAWEFLEGPATVERIRDRLVAGEFHALHLTAHGLSRSDEAMARLVLETGDGYANFVDEELFSEVFAGQQSLRLVSLIACHGGAQAGRDPFSGLGPALVRRGVPAVLAMRRQISLTGAMRFTEHFYRNLARTGLVDAAANEARSQLFLGGSDSLEWGTPTLFMRLAEGRLWRLPTGSMAEDEAASLGDQEKLAAAEVKTLLHSELVDRNRLAEELGDELMAEILRRHDRLARDLLQKHEGREADRTDGFLMLFDRPYHAVRWALAFHREMAELSGELNVELVSRIGIHLGEVVLIETPPADVARGAKPLEVEGMAKPTAARLMSLAQPGQTLLSATAFDLARRSVVGTVRDEKLRWIAHGEYLLGATTTPMAVFEVGVEGSAPLAAPSDSATGRRAAGDQTILGWRPGIGLEVPQRPNWVFEKKLSEGGFGEVWLASHEKIHRQRVFKYCFEAERLKALQREITLFRLLKEELGDRDDIARILDWNFDRAPYFIESEYAADGDLTEWAKEQGGIGNVPMEQRLEIVAQLAAALSAAHSVGVLHKDIKPANVLIAANPEGQLQVRLADFGIGTVTERDRLAAAGITVMGLTAKTEEESSYSGTRIYMAPELLEGKRATIQADVYALGVVLYQAVVGDFTKALAPGWRRDVDDELLREDIALAVDGSPKRRLGNALRITERLRSLENRRQEREAERREGEQAQRVKEALSKSRRRRKLMGVMIAALAIIVSTVAYYAFQLEVEAERARSQAERANREAERANREAKHAQRVSQFMVDLFEVSDPAVGLGAKITARELLDQGAEKIQEELKEVPRTQTRLMDTIGRVYHRLGLYESAELLLEDALEIRRDLLGAEHPALAGSFYHLAELYRDQDRHEEAEQSYKRALAVGEKIQAPNQSETAKILIGLGVLYFRQGRFDEAEQLYQRILGLTGGASISDQSAVARSLNNLAVVYFTEGRYEEAGSLYLRALGILEQAHGEGDPETATAASNLGLVYLLQKRYGLAEPFCLRAVTTLGKILGPDHPDLSRSLTNLAEVYRAQGRYREAEPLYKRALGILEKSLGPRHVRVGVNLNNLGELYRDQGRFSVAEPFYRSALTIFEEALGRGHIYVASPLLGLAKIQRRQDKYELAEVSLRRALAIQEATLVPGHPDFQNTLVEYAALLRSMGRDEKAKKIENRVDLPGPAE